MVRTYIDAARFLTAALLFFANSGFTLAPQPARQNGARQNGARQHEARQDGSGKVFFLFRDSDGALALHDPAGGPAHRLTEPGGQDGFWISPSGRQLVVGDRLLRLSLGPDGAPLVEGRGLEGLPGPGGVSWSPDEAGFAYAGPDGTVWLEPGDGTRQPMPGASTLPSWSADGSWLAYCSLDGTLFVQKAGGEPVEAAREAVCGSGPGGFAWSPGAPQLAYTLEGTLDPDTRHTSVYDAEAGASRLLLDAGAVEAWSPDGKLVALTRVDIQGASAYGYTALIADPESGLLLEVGQFHSRQPGRRSWTPIPAGGYAWGAHSIAPDLSAAEPFADALLDATPTGARVLTGSGPEAAFEVACLERETGRGRTLLTVDLTDAPGAAMPGLWGSLSLNGEWAALTDFQSEGFTGWLARCERGEPERLGEGLLPDRLLFSPDGARLAYLLFPAEDPESLQVMLRDLEAGTTQTLAAAPDSPLAWVELLPSAAQDPFAENSAQEAPNLLLLLCIGGLVFAAFTALPIVFVLRRRPDPAPPPPGSP